MADGFFMVRPIAVTGSVLTSSTVAEPSTGEVAWLVGSTYAAGARVISTTTHGVWESASAGNIGNALPGVGADNAHWLWVGYDNRHAMFDRVISSQTVDGDEIEVELAIDGQADTVALLNISGTSARFRSDAGLGYDQNRSLISNSGITDYDLYYEEPVVRYTDWIETGLPINPGPNITVTLSEAGEDVACGVLIVGQKRKLGTTRFGGAVGVDDYSKFAENFAGELDVVERPFNKRGDFEVWVLDDQVDEVCRLLALYRATPILYVADTAFRCTYNYGFPRSWGVVLSEGGQKLLSIKIKSLI